MARGTHQPSRNQSSKTGNGNQAHQQSKSAQEIADATAANVSTAERDNTAVGLPVKSEGKNSEHTASEAAQARAEARSENVVEPDEDREDHSGAAYRVAKPNGRILKPGDEITFDVDDDDENSVYVKVKQDIYREVTARNAQRKTYVLLYAAGTNVPRTMLQKVG